MYPNTDCPHDCYRPGECDGSCTHSEPADRYSYKTYRQEWRVNSVEVDHYDCNPRVYATAAFPTREEAEAHRLAIAKPHQFVEGRWVPNDAPHSYVDCYVQYTETVSEKRIQTSDRGVNKSRTDFCKMPAKCQLGRKTPNQIPQ